MEQLLQKHRKQQRDLQSQITQKKKSASKKIRKSINDECERLEQDLKAKQAEEIATFTNRTEGQDVQDTTQVLDRYLNNGEDKSSDLLDTIVGATKSGDSKLENVHVSGNGEDVETQKTQQSGKPNRQKARLARRAAENDAARAQAADEAAHMPDLKTQERNKMLAEIRKRGLVEKEVAANGHCLYLAVADQMTQQKLSLDPVQELSDGSRSDSAGKNDLPGYKKVRVAAADYIASHSQDFEPFLEEPIDGYLHKLRDTGEWGGQLELAALAKAYRININVLQGSGRLETIASGVVGDSHEAWLAYYRHGFGLGEHYNSLRKAAQSAPEG